MRGDGDKTFEVSSLELLRRAIAHSDQDAWAGFQQCLEETVLTWLHAHPSREAACRGLCEKYVVAQAFERFRQGAVQAQMAFETPAGILVYLQASLNGVILDTLRTLSRPKAVLWLVPGLAGEPRMEDQIDSNEIWEVLQTLLPSARERRLAYLLYQAPSYVRCHQGQSSRHFEREHLLKRKNTERIRDFNRKFHFTCHTWTPKPAEAIDKPSGDQATPLTGPL